MEPLSSSGERDPRFPDYSRHTSPVPAQSAPVSQPQPVPVATPVEQPMSRPISQFTQPVSQPAVPSAPQSVVIIGAGLGGLAAACLLSAKGYKVTVIEKEQEVGGWLTPEAQSGYLFDRMPSMYMLPNIFEHIFTLCGERIEDYIQLSRLNPAFRLIFKETEQIVDMRCDPTIDGRRFEEFEKGDAEALEKYKEQCQQIFDKAMSGYLFEDHAAKLTSLFNIERTRNAMDAGLFTSLGRHTRSIEGEMLRKAMQYQALMLGSSPDSLPALYAMFTQQDFESGILYPQGGMSAVAKAFKALSEKHGAQYRMGQKVEKIIVQAGTAVGVELTGGQTVMAEHVISNADLYQTETALLPEGSRQYPESFWKSASLTASAFVLNLGIKGPVDQLLHHTIMMSKDWQRSNQEIFGEKRLASDPSFYISVPSKTDRAYAPEGNESVTVFVPIPAGIEQSQQDIDLYTEQILRTLEHDARIADLRTRIDYQRAYCLTAPEYTEHSYGGSIHGLTHTSGVASIRRPMVKSQAVAQLYRVGAHTQPGLGQSMGLIAAEIAYKHIVGIESKGPLENL